MYTFQGRQIPHLEIALDLDMWGGKTFSAWPIELAIHASRQRILTSVHLTREYWDKIVRRHEREPRHEPGGDPCNYCRFQFFEKQGGISVLYKEFTADDISDLLMAYGPLLCVVDARRYTECLGLTTSGIVDPLPHVTIVVGCVDRYVFLEDPIWKECVVPTDVFIAALGAHSTGGMIIGLKGGAPG